MKKYLLLAAIILGIFLRQPDTGGTADMLLTMGSILGIWLLAGSLATSQKFPLFPGIGAIFLAVSPWYIYISAFPEKNLAVFLAITLVYLSIKLFKKYNLLPATLFLIIILLFLVSTPKDLLHGYLNTQAPIWLTDEQRREHGSFYSLPLVVAAHNRLVNYSLSFLDIYGQHFQGDFLFVSGDVRNPTGGMMYFFDFFFIISALVLIMRKSPTWKIILIWLFLAPIPSALDFHPPNATKAYLMIVPLTLLSAYGASYFISKFSTIRTLK